VIIIASIPDFNGLEISSELSDPGEPFLEYETAENGIISLFWPFCATHASGIKHIADQNRSRAGGLFSCLLKREVIITVAQGMKL
jgi:hypothetical protein